MSATAGDVARRSSWQGRGTLVGREQELSELLGALRTVEAGAGDAVLLEGPAGMGKSPAARRGLRAGAARGCRVSGRTCFGAESSFAFGVAGQLLEPLLLSLPPARRDELLAGPTALAHRVLNGVTRAIGLPSSRWTPTPRCTRCTCSWPTSPARVSRCSSPLRRRADRRAFAALAGLPVAAARIRPGGDGDHPVHRHRARRSGAADRGHHDAAADAAASSRSRRLHAAAGRGVLRRRRRGVRRGLPGSDRRHAVPPWSAGSRARRADVAPTDAAAARMQDASGRGRSPRRY